MNENKQTDAYCLDCRVLCNRGDKAHQGHSIVARPDSEVKEPPPLGVSVAETIETEDKSGG